MSASLNGQAHREGSSLTHEAEASHAPEVLCHVAAVDTSRLHQKASLSVNPIQGWRVEQEHAGLLETTIRRRIDDLRTFERFLDEKPLLTATRDDILAWLDSRPLSAKRRYDLLSGLSCFYRWAVLDELTEVDPTARIRRPKLRRYLPRPMPRTDLEVALSAATPQMTAWLLLGAMTGLRCKEIAGADVQDLHVDQDPPVMVVHGKGDKERIVPLHPLVVLALQAGAAQRPGPLFRNAAGRRYSAATVSQRINAFLHGLGINATAHQLRHRFGTDVYRLSRDLRMTQELLGHASPTTTAVYAAWSPVESAGIVQQLEAPRSTQPV